MTTDNKTNTAHISDEQLVDYLLNLLPDNEHDKLQQRIAVDIELQDRFHSWQNALFRFHDETAEQAPPKRVWDNLEKQLFADESFQKKRHWWQMPLHQALLSFCLIAGIGFFVLQPTYHPTDSAQYHTTIDSRFFPIKLWDVEGDKSSIAFTSLHDVSEPGRECVAWLKQGDNEPVRLGAIPDTGNKTLRRMPLPNQLTASAGDKIIIAMVKHGDTRLPPKSEQHIATLNSI